MNDLLARLRSTLPACPYDPRSPDYYTAPDDKPCIVCGSINEVSAPNLCQGADTRCMAEAADEIERLRAVILVNGLRWGASEEEIDRVVNGE